MFSLPFHAIDHRVQPGLVCWPCCVAPQRLSIHDERDLDDVRIVAAAVLLVRQFNDCVGAVIQVTLQAVHLPLGVLPHGIGDIEVLALDDRPHG